MSNNINNNFKVFTDQQITKKAKYKIKNEKEKYEVIHFETSAEQVVTNDSFQFVTREEKEGWNNKLETLNTELIDSRYSPFYEEQHATLGHRLNHMDELMYLLINGRTIDGGNLGDEKE